MVLLLARLSHMSTADLGGARPQVGVLTSCWLVHRALPFLLEVLSMFSWQDRDQ